MPAPTYLRSPGAPLPRAGLCLALAMAGAASSGCGDPPVGDALVVRDSVGVQVAEIDWDRVETRWELEPEPSWVIGDETGERFPVPLHQVEDLEELEDSWIAIAEGSTQEVIWVDLDEETVRRVGGAGDGPEEFHRLRSLFRSNEGRLGGLDAGRHRIVLWDTAGRVMEAESVAPWSSPRASQFLVVSNAGSRFLINVAGAPAEWTEGWSRSQAPVIRLGPDPDTVLTNPGSEVVMLSEPLLYTGLEFGATTVATGGRDGVWVGDSRDAEVTHWTGPDGPTEIIRWRSALDEIRMDRTWALDARLERMDEAERQVWERIHGVVPESEPLPAFHALLGGPNGELWIGRRTPLEGGAADHEVEYEWLVVGADLSTAGRTRTPSGFVPYRVGDGYLLGVRTDSLGRETVRRYDLRPARGRVRVLKRQLGGKRGWLG